MESVVYCVWIDRPGLFSAAIAGETFFVEEVHVGFGITDARSLSDEDMTGNSF